MSDEDSPIDRAREALGEGASAAREKLQEGYDRVSTDLRREADRATEAARERYDVAAEHVRDGYDRVQRDFVDLSEDLNDYVRDYPGRAVLIAVFVGFLFGLLFRGGSDD